MKTIPIYGASGDALTEGSTTGLQLVDITTVGVLNGNTSQVYAIKNPLVFIYGVSSLDDWYTDTESFQNNTLWGDGADKSIFDPCPKGWRVPTDSGLTFGDFTTASTASGSEYTTAAGRTYNKMTWYPAMGYRNGNSGTLNAVGYYGYSWSASVSGTNAKRLGFSLSGVSPGAIGTRACCFPARCIQE